MADEQTEETTERRSIIGAKYNNRYKEKDWLGQFVDAQATDPVMKTKRTKVKDDEGNETVNVEEVDSGKRALNLDSLFALAEANHIDVAHLREQRDRPNAPGRIRMTVGNLLRAAARHRHGLNTVDGEWTDAPAELIGENPRTQERDGTKIVVAKPEAVEAAPVASE